MNENNKIGKLHFGVMNEKEVNYVSEILDIEEYESLRLKYIVGLDYKEAAKNMAVEEHYYLKKIDKGVEKIIKTLLKGEILEIEDTDYNSYSRCKCAVCGYKYLINYKKDAINCPECLSTKVINQFK